MLDPVRRPRRRHRAGERDLLPSAGSHPALPGGVSETEILFPYGSASFASKAGALAGNHFATVVEGLDGLRELGRRALWEGAQPIEFVEP